MFLDGLCLFYVTAYFEIVPSKVTTAVFEYIMMFMV